MKGHQLGISFLLIFVLLFSITKNSLMLSFYLIDNEDFTELFCENTDSPEMECNGKCELSKLAHQDDTKSERPSLLDNLQNELVYYMNYSSLEIFLFKLNLIPKFEYQNSYNFLYSKPIVHPPILV